MTRILHLTPHLGGGVGKAVSGLIDAARRADAPDEHVVICLEQPEKTKSAEIIAGDRLIVCPSEDVLHREIERADIVQLEFWNHPATVGLLCARSLPEMRLLVWCHVSGLYSPRLPPGLIRVAAKILFTSACSFEAQEVKEWLSSGDAGKLAVVSSGGELDRPPIERAVPRGPLRAGYLGSLNPAKLHPDFVRAAASVRLADFSIRMIGDETNRSELERQCRGFGKFDLLQFRGYRADVAAELAEIDSLIYLLNPTHYGTAENALLEAMAAGVVPIVLDNPCERHIVENRQTGIVLGHPDELADALDWLAGHPEEHLAMGRNASDFVRRHFQYGQMQAAFAQHYDVLLDEPKRAISFAPVFGQTPAQWYRAFHRDTSILRDDGTVAVPDGVARYGLFERSKGSVFHFSRYFPDDPLLGKWAQSLGQQIGA